MCVAGLAKLHSNQVWSVMVVLATSVQSNVHIAASGLCLYSTIH